MSERVQISIEQGVAHVRLSRADKMNALDGAMFEALAATIDRLKADNSVRVVVLSGEGRAFCAGLDMGSFAAMASGDGAGVGSEGVSTLAQRTHGIANLPQYVAWGWREIPVPVIAAVHGVAYGGGFQIALGADMRYATADTRMSVMEIKWGLVPDLAGTQLMRDLAREDLIRDLTYTGRVFSGTEAAEYGFVTRICDDPLAEALAAAEAIAARNPDAIRGDKQLLNEAKYLTAAEGLLMESRLQDAIVGSANQVEAVMSEMEKRPANFADPS